MGRHDKMCKHCDFPERDHCCGTRTRNLLEELRLANGMLQSALDNERALVEGELKVRRQNGVIIRSMCDYEIKRHGDRSVLLASAVLNAIENQLPATTGIQPHDDTTEPATITNSVHARLEAAWNEIAEWKEASGLEKGGDPDAVTPDDLRKFIAGRDDVIRRHRERQQRKRENGGTRDVPMWKPDEEWHGDGKSLCQNAHFDVELENTNKGATISVTTRMPDGIMNRTYFLKDMLDA